MWYRILQMGDGWYSTIDVFNRSFTPGMAAFLESEHHGAEAIIMQGSTFSYSCGFFTRSYAQEAIELIKDYDAGKLDIDPPLPDLVSDETVLRAHSKFEFAKCHRMAFAYAETDWEKAPLLHFSRSVLQHPVRQGVV